MEVTEGAINCKLQVVGVGTSSREEGGNLEVAVESDFFFFMFHYMPSCYLSSNLQNCFEFNRPTF